MKFLVTGATGFVGSHLSRHLVRNGHTVIAVSRKGCTDLIKDLLAEPTFQLRNADLAYYDRIASILGDAEVLDGIFHLAAQLPGPDVTLRDMIHGNVVAMGNVLEAAHRFSIPKIIISSTMSIYGLPASLPVTESTPANTREFYGLTKLQAEELARMAASMWNLHVVCLRYCGIFGLGNSYGSISLYTTRVLNNQPVEVFAKGRIIKDFVSVHDVVKANLQAFEKGDEFSFEVFNIGGGEPMRLSNIAQLVVQATGRGEVILTDQGAHGVSDFAYDISKAKQLLHYRPTPFAQRIEEYVEQMRQLMIVKNQLEAIS